MPLDPPVDSNDAQQSWLASFVRDCVERGKTLHLEGLGKFRVGGDGHVEFHQERGDRIFIAYSAEDREHALRLYDDLRAAGYQPWIDRKKLLAGQNWPRAIEYAIGISDFFVPLFSKLTAGKRGNFHAELRYALDCAKRVPLDEIFILPARLDPCTIPSRITVETQYIDLYPDWRLGVLRLLETIERQRRLRQR